MKKLKKMNLSENAMEVLKYRYLSPNETPEAMMTRVASHTASVEPTKELVSKWRGEFLNLLLDLDFVPNTPTLINAGNTNQLCACFVLGIKDDTESIFNALRDTAMIHKSGGGTGFDFSDLRPAGQKVDNTKGTASGPISFMKVYNAATKEMKQGGVRRGANMGVLRVDHPDIMEFLDAKLVEGNLDNFNLSVAITEEFMRLLENPDYDEQGHARQKDSFKLRFGGTDDVADSYIGGHVTRVNPRDVWDKIVEGAHKNGEPGLIFIDRINELNPLRSIEVLKATNPCGEQPLPKNGSCNLGHINLPNFWNSEYNDMDWPRLQTTVRTAVRFLDNNIDACNYPLMDIRLEALEKRRIGLGIMGLADLFLLAGIRYGSKESIKFTDTLMKKIYRFADTASRKLGGERGIFPANMAKESSLLQRRNGTLLTVAPTGSCSIIANCSPGCEPIFAYSFKKKCIDGDIIVHHPYAKEYIDNALPLPECFITAMEVTPLEHIRVQACIQKYVDSGISKTINAPNNTSLDQVSDLLMCAYEEGCKSITFYREGSRETEAQVEIKEPDKTPEPTFIPIGAVHHEVYAEPRTEDSVFPYEKRPTRLEGCTYKIPTGRGKLYLTINEDGNGMPVEVFAKIGKSGKEDFAYTEALGRVLTLALRWGVPLDVLHKHLSGITGYDTTWDNGELVKSVPDAIAKIFDREYQIKADKQHVAYAATEDPTERLYTKLEPKFLPDCPSCGGYLENVEGCEKCLLCGYSLCGG